MDTEQKDRLQQLRRLLCGGEENTVQECIPIEEEWRRKYEEERRRSQYSFLRYEENRRLFLETEGLYVLDPDGRITSQEVYRIYRNWCISEKIPLYPPRALWLYLKDEGAKYGIMQSGHIPTPEGKRVRGFLGIRPMTEQEKEAFPDGPKWRGWDG